MKLAKTNQGEIDNLMKILNEVECLHKELIYKNFEDVELSEFEIMSKLKTSDSSAFLENLLKHISAIHYQRILWNCSTLLDNCADPDLSYLDFNKDIKAGLELLEKERGKESSIQNQMGKVFPTHTTDINGQTIKLGDMVRYDFDGELSVFEVVFEKNSFRKKYTKWDETIEKPLLEYGEKAKEMRLKIIS